MEKISLPLPDEAERELSNQLFEAANLGLPEADFLLKVSTLFIRFFSCEAIELWLPEETKLVRCETTTQPREPYLLEMNIAAKPKVDNMVPFTSPLEKLMWDLWEDPWQCLHSLSQNQWIVDPWGRKRGERIDPDYESIAFTPLLVGHRKIGVLLLKSEKENFFDGKKLESAGTAILNLGMALINHHAQAALLERVKELTCLYHISKVMARPECKLEEVFQAMLQNLPMAWQYPEIAFGRILFDNRVYVPTNFRETAWRQAAPIFVRGKPSGLIEIFYAEEKPELYEGPFLKEERNLIDAISRQVSLFIEQREAEKAKVRLEDQLRHADRLATIGQLAAGVAHEMNEPIGNILGFAQLAKKISRLPQQAEKDLDKIISASLHAREVIRKLMLFSRQMPPGEAWLNLNRVVEEGLFLFQARCAKQGIKLTLNLSPELPAIKGDPTQLTQVLTNLVVNAIQAMPKGGRLTVQTRNEKDRVSLIIEDTGDGMSEEVLTRIFIPFFTTKDVNQGTGLGLAVAHGIVTAHKGSIQVESRVGQGSRFEIRLPAEPKLEEEEIHEGP